MKSNDKQYSIYIRSAGISVPCNKEQFDDYYRDINSYRRNQMNHGRCVCPPSKWLQCDMDCCNCPYRTDGDVKYLEDFSTDNEEGGKPWLDKLQEEMPEFVTSSFEDDVLDAQYIDQILKRLCEIMPVAINIGEYRLQGMSEKAIENKIGIGRKTYAYRLKKVFELIKKEFPEIF